MILEEPSNECIHLELLANIISHDKQSEAFAPQINGHPSFIAWYWNQNLIYCYWYEQHFGFNFIWYCLSYSSPRSWKMFLWWSHIHSFTPWVIERSISFETHTHTYGQSRNSSQSNGYLIYFVNAQSSVHMLNEMGSDDILLAKSVCFLYSTYRLILSQTQTHTTCTFITLSSIKNEKNKRKCRLIHDFWFLRDSIDQLSISSTLICYKSIKWE